MTASPAPYTINDGAYWDRYVQQWERDPNTNQLECVGREWHGEEIFVAMLQRLADQDDVALEIGCGGGRVTSQVHDRFRHVVAADVSVEMLRRCQQLVGGHNVTFHTLDGFTLEPAEDQSLDFVYSHDVFVHFSSLQVYAYLREIWRTLRPGGRAMLSFYGFQQHFDLFRRMSLEFQQQGIVPPHMRVHFLTEAMLRHMLQDIGFEVLEVDEQNFLIAAFQRPTDSAGNLE